jgi:hypothetical protein
MSEGLCSPRANPDFDAASAVPDVPGGMMLHQPGAMVLICGAAAVLIEEAQTALCGSFPHSGNASEIAPTPLCAKCL